MRLRLVGGGLLAASLLGLVGCGGVSLAPVSGTVTYKKKPLPSGSITFHPATGRPSNGIIKDGQIVDVTTFKAGDGAIQGPMKVTIIAVTNPDDMMAKHDSLIPTKYGSVDKSGLTAEIKSGKNELSFDLVD